MKAYIYCKMDGMRSYKAFDLGEGVEVNRLIYATILEVTEENKVQLQNLADNNKHINLSIQMRVGNKIYFTTK